MPRFSRPLFFGLQRLFPPAGPSINYPTEVSDTVNFTKNYQRWDFLHQCNLRRDIQFVVAPGGADVVFLITEPLPGYFQVPVSWSLWHNTAAASVPAILDLLIGAVSGAAQDPWGGWDTVNRTLEQVVIPAAGVAIFAQVDLKRVLPCTAGFQYRVTFVTPAAGVVVRSHFYYLDIPGDIIDLSAFARKPQMF